MPGTLPTGLGNDQQASQATAFMRQQPWYLDFLAKNGIKPGEGDQVNLNDQQRAQLMATALQNGIGFNHKYDMIDANGQIAEEHHKLKKVAIAAAIAGLALTGLGAAGIGPLAGALGGATTAGTIPTTMGLTGAEFGGAAATAAVPAAIGGAAAAGGAGLAAIPTTMGLTGAEFGGAAATGALPSVTAGSAMAGMAADAFPGALEGQVGGYAGTAAGGAADAGGAATGVAGAGSSAASSAAAPFANGEVNPDYVYGQGTDASMVGPNGAGSTGGLNTTSAGSRFANALNLANKVGQTLSGSGVDANGNPINAPQSSAYADKAQALTNNRFLQTKIDQNGPATDKSAMQNMMRAGIISRMDPNAAPISMGGHVLPNLAPTQAGSDFATDFQKQLRARQTAGKSLTLSGVPDPTQAELDAQNKAEDASGTGTGVNSRITQAGNYINQGARLANMGFNTYNAVRGLWS